MNDYIYFSNNNQDNEYTNQLDQNSFNNPLMAFSLRNMSTAYNSFIFNDFQLLNNNEIKQKNEFNDIFKQKNKEIESKANNNYYKKKDYSKFLNVPQSNYSTFCDSNNKFYSKSHFMIPNLNSNLKENKIYNKLKINDLIEITQNRKKRIEEKNKLEKLKKLKISLEEEQLLKLLIDDDSNKNKICEEGVQTSLTIKKNNNENKNKNSEMNNKNLKIKDKNTIENDLVNIGIETEKNIDSNTYDNNDYNSELSFDIEVNEDSLKQNQKIIFCDSFENKNKENSSNSNPNEENEISNVEEYDINKECLKNETKSDIQDYIIENEKSIKKEKINFKLNKSKSVLSMGLNRYENIDNKKTENLDSIINNKQYDDQNQINIDDINLNKNMKKIYNSNMNINKQGKYTINLSKNESKRIIILTSSKQNINNKSETNRTKKKRQINNYSYYFKLKEQSKINKTAFQ